jgi:hypothetical protein
MKKPVNKLGQIVLLALLLVVQLSWAQNVPIRCAFDQFQTRNKALVKTFSKEMNQYFSKENVRLSNEEPPILKIPVVVHVIHNNSSNTIGGPNNSNISDEQIKSQITVLNQDYRRQLGTNGFNNNPVGADTRLEFVLAKTDPNGNPSTGIVRKYTPKSDFDILDLNQQKDISKISYWSSKCYLNIWLVSLSGGFLGYGAFPSSPMPQGLTDETPEEIDGVFMDYKYFGKDPSATYTRYYNQGRTLTHEIGHWFGLIHTWGDENCGTDYCEDTPLAADGNLSLSCRQVLANCNGKKTPQMIENYMDYSVDTCMNVFTKDQSLRMREVLQFSPRRIEFVKCSNAAVLANEDSQPQNFSYNLKNGILTVNGPNKLNQDTQIQLLTLKGSIVYNDSVFKNNQISSNINVKLLRPGIYILRIHSKKNNITKKLTINL